VDKQQSAGVIGNTLVSCVAGLSRRERQDVTKSCQLAKWDADRRYDSTIHPGEWFLRYCAVLKFLGWLPSGDEITEVHRPDFSGSVTRAYLKWIAGVGGDSMMGVTADMLKALKADATVMGSFSTNSLLGEDFRIMSAERDSQGYLRIVANHFRLLSNVKRKEFIFWEWEGKTATLLQNFGCFRLDVQTFEQNREFLERRIEEINMSYIELTI
jgi:hypothetical protein